MAVTGCNKDASKGASSSRLSAFTVLSAECVVQDAPASTNKRPSRNKAGIEAKQSDDSTRKR